MRATPELATTYRVKIFGAGSIGNHLAHASRELGWEVVVCDVDQAALIRMQEEIYPSRYGEWDFSIKLCLNSEAPVGGFDLICVGTPPDHHVKLAFQALEEKPSALLVEKPFCTPALDGAQEFYLAARDSSTQVFVGYDHVVGRATKQAEELIQSGIIGAVRTIDVEFREYWGGIFKAHPWLDGPEDSYLGFWERGGGASGEHSHAVNLWQHFAHISGFGRVVEVSAMVHYVKQGKANYDDLCLMNLRTEKGLVGRVIQDVITLPPRKRVRVHGTSGVVEWVSGYNAEGDAVRCLIPGRDDQVYLVPKKRSDDFIEELKHLQARVEQPSTPSDISFERGLDTMLVVAAAHEAEQSLSCIQIDFNQGYTLDALRK